MAPRSTGRPGKKCGQSYIAANATCNVNRRSRKKAAIAVGVGAAAGLTAAALIARRNRIQPVSVSVQAGPPGRIKGAAPQKLLRGRNPNPRLTGRETKGLLNPAKRPQSKTERMRSNVSALERRAERRIAQTARKEATRVAEIGNTMAAAGEATGARAKLTARNFRLRVEAARRRFEPGYRRNQNRVQTSRMPEELPRLANRANFMLQPRQRVR